MVSAVDDGVGLLLGSLAKNGLEEKTIVVFLSDNGGPTTKNASSNSPLRGNKSDAWEGGYRVPFALQWKGTLPPAKTYDHPVSSLDLAATIVALSGAKAAKGRPLDGVNLIPFLKGENDSPPHDAIYLRKFDQNRFAVRLGKFKTVIPWKGGPPRLFNLEKDIAETKDLASEYPAKVAEIETLRKKWNAQLVDPTFLGLIHSKAKRKKKK